MVEEVATRIEIAENDDGGYYIVMLTGPFLDEDAAEIELNVLLSDLGITMEALH